MNADRVHKVQQPSLEAVFQEAERDARSGFPLPRPLPTTLPIRVSPYWPAPARQPCGEGGTQRPVNGYTARTPRPKPRTPLCCSPAMVRAEGPRVKTEILRRTVRTVMICRCDRAPNTPCSFRFDGRQSKGSGTFFGFDLWPAVNAKRPKNEPDPAPHPIHSRNSA